MKRRIACLALFLSAALPAFAIDAGLARVDVTPTEPIRLTGYGNRRTNSIGVEQKLWAKALALGSDREGPVLLLTLDNCGIAESTYRELVAWLTKNTKLKPGGIAIACSHTHSGPCTTDWAPNIFSADIVPEQQAAIDRYTGLLLHNLKRVAFTALKDRRPAQLAWAQGEVGFARNRRVVVGNTANFGENASGPVDHALPVLRVMGADGKLRALVANYACHCTTLGGEFNHVCGDWAGYAQEAIERDHPGATALITIGCGADANPFPRGTLALARQHGDELAAEVKRLLGLTFTPLTGKLTTGYKEIRLPFGPHFTRDEWQARATNSGIVGYHAKKWLARLNRGEKQPDSLYYPINTWRFGDDLAMVFLPGEVVVDYALRLKNEFDPQRLWVTAYANYVPCYIPSRRILAEGGYEAEGSLWYYDRPARISTNAEELIIKTVHELMPKSFRVDPKKAEFPDPLTPKQALGAFRTKANFTVELVASEPLIESPVAIDWDARGRLWVCEMYDYPTGLKPPPEQDRKWGEPIKAPPGGFTPGGRIKILTSSKGDGHYDKATLFLDGLAFPTGVFPWRNGALICAAPDILYAEDTDGDGRADVVRTNFTGFATHNFQARVNGFRWGLDGWLHGSSGLFGGKIKSLLIGKEVDLGGRDFRIKPDTGEIEPLAGVSQFGRVRDDFDNWFGNDNSTLLWHYPLAEHYMRRNPHVSYPDPRVLVAKAGVRERESEGVGTNAPPHSLTSPLPRSRSAANQPYDPNRVFPTSRTLDRFNHPESANRVTSACGIDIYRDNLLGAEYYGNAFICEPVHNLVTRLVLEPEGVTFAGRRADDEQRGEFLASTDNWFRPVQVRTGPDGALWVVDMYRFVIEHPRWIAPHRLKALDVRAGADKGRIYRVYPKGAKLRPIRDLTKLNDLGDARGDNRIDALNSPNGAVRDLVHIELVARHTGTNAKSLSSFATRLTLILSRQFTNPAVRVQGLSALEQLGACNAEQLTEWAKDPDARVRRVVARLSEQFPKLWPHHGYVRNLGAPDVLLTLGSDPDPVVQFQAALSLGAFPQNSGGDVHVRFASHKDQWLRAAALSSVSNSPAGFAARLVDNSKLAFGTSPAFPDSPVVTAAVRDVIEQLMRAAVVAGDWQGVAMFIDRLPRFHPPKLDKPSPLLAASVGSFLEATDRKNAAWQEFLRGPLPDYAKTFEAEAKKRQEESIVRLNEFLKVARTCLSDEATSWEFGASPSEEALACVRLLGHDAEALDSDAQDLCRWLEFPAVAQAPKPWIDVLGRLRAAVVAPKLIEHWPRYSPRLREPLISLLLTRDESIRVLLSAIQQRTVAANEVPLAARQRTLKHSDSSIRSVAATVFQRSEAASRSEVLARFDSVANIAAAADRGAALFDKHCAQCHAYRGHGHAVGPNLAEFAGKGVADFVLAILDPNAAINPNFLAYNVETKDGRSLTGIVRGETAGGLTLVQGGGVEEKILRGDIAEIRASALSLMPEGLEQALSPQDMADLIAWLKQGAPAPFGHASANPDVAAKNRAEFLKSGASSVAKVVSAAETLPYRSWIGTLPLAYCRQSAGVNGLAWESPLTPALSPSEGEREKRGAAVGEVVSFRFPAAMGFLSQPHGKFALHLNGKSVLDFDVSLTDATWASSDGRVRMSYAVMEANTEDCSGPLLIEVDSSLVEAGKPVRFEVTGSESGSQRWFGMYLLER